MVFLLEKGNFPCWGFMKHRDRSFMTSRRKSPSPLRMGYKVGFVTSYNGMYRGELTPVTQW